MWERSNKLTEIYPSSNVSEEENDSSGSLITQSNRSKLLGMCNYFGFVVMLIAAHDILHQEKTSNRGNQVWFELESLRTTVYDKNITSDFSFKKVSGAVNM
ncbi:unnamed protein product [Pocillopora meandrina]|uniref:Uncharacterized protein n=1 Tax=Pocillopora meandrina TaxID=46732 RepID=A0AAU9W3J1_9CNID|nr:unnamed protein product [Pocillopora meandrina]